MVTWSVSDDVNEIVNEIVSVIDGCDVCEISIVNVIVIGMQPSDAQVNDVWVNVSDGDASCLSVEIV